MATPQTFSLEETIALVAEKASSLKATGRPPVFDLNLSRRNTAGVPQQLASFSGATLEHIQDPVRWLPMLCGGGDYILNVRHEDLPGRIGGPVGVNFDKSGPGMEPRQVDPRIARSPMWAGPMLTGGAYTEPPANGHVGATAMPWAQGGPGVQMTSGYSSLPGQPAPQADRERELTTQLAEMKAQLARSEAEARARTELEAERRASEARVREAEQRAERAMRESEARTAGQIAELKAAQAPRPDPSAGWEKLTTVIMPLVQQMLTSQHEMRVLSMKMSEDQNRRQIEASEKQHQAQMEMIRAITAQKPGMSDEMKMLIAQLQADKKDGGSDAIAAMLTRQVEAMGMMSKMSIGMIETVADLQMGDSEHPAVGAIREFAMAMKTMMEGQKESTQRVIPKKLPAGKQPQYTPQQIAQIQLQQRQRQAQAQAQAAAAAQAGRTGPVKQAAPGPQVVNVPSGPVPTAPAQVIQFVPPAPAVQPPAPPAMNVSHFDVLKAGIEALKPQEEVVEYLFKLVKADEPTLKAQLDKHDGSPFALFQATFGQPFITRNWLYFKELGELVDSRGIEEGLWTADETDVDENESELEPTEPELAPVEEPTTEQAVIPLDVEPVVPVPESHAIIDPVPPTA